MKTFEKLKIRIQKDIGIELTNFERTYIGYYGRANGQWKWRAQF